MWYDNPMRKYSIHVAQNARCPDSIEDADDKYFRTPQTIYVICNSDTAAIDIAKILCSKKKYTRKGDSVMIHIGKGENEVIFPIAYVSEDGSTWKRTK